MALASVLLPVPGKPAKSTQVVDADSMLSAAMPGLFVQHAAVTHVQDAVSNRGRLRVVRDHQHRLLELLGRAPQHLQHRIGIDGVQIPGRLIGKDNRRTRNERAGNRDRCCSPPESSEGR